MLWQHNANPSYKLASIPRYDDIVQTAGWAGSARVADRRATGRPQNREPHTGSGRGRPAGDRPPTGSFSTLLRQSGMRASTGGFLATKSERKMLASTCLYSRYAWLFRVVAHATYIALTQTMSCLTTDRNIFLNLLSTYIFVVHYMLCFIKKLVFVYRMLGLTSVPVSLGPSQNQPDAFYRQERFCGGRGPRPPHRCLAPLVHNDISIRYVSYIQSDDFFILDNTIN